MPPWRVVRSRCEDMAIKIYFWCDPYSEKTGNFQHDIINIAEGLRELGVMFYSNTNYWDPCEGKFLFESTREIAPEQADVLVYNSEYFQNHESVPQIFGARSRPFLVWLDSADGQFTASHRPDVQKCDLILKSHYSSFQRYPDQTEPWAFGMSTRIMRHLGVVVPWIQRENVMLVNYRCNHPVRLEADKLLAEICQIHFGIDRRRDPFWAEGMDAYDERCCRLSHGRHMPSYLKRLQASRYGFAFGGERGYRCDGLDRFLERRNILWRLREKRQIVYQWDSWRFWECLLAGCVTFHLDFEKYGFRLPVMPTSGSQYIGFDLRRPARIEALLSDQERLKKISTIGREWAVQHYSPKATAVRFLELLRLRGVDVQGLFATLRRDNHERQKLGES
jgi:hypothetical protein